MTEAKTLRGLCLTTAIALIAVPAMAQNSQSQSQQTSQGQGQACRQQLTELERQLTNVSQDRRSEIERKMREARTALDRNNEAECTRIVADVRKSVNPQAAGASDGTQIQVQQPAPQVTVQRQAPEVQVQQPAPQVTVQQPQPQVTVQQPRPEVTVQQPQPQVTVQQPKPEVTVQQARPEVNVQQQGQPQVTVQRQGEPQVNVQRQGEPQVNVQQSQARQDQSTQQQNRQQSAQQQGGVQQQQGQTRESASGAVGTTVIMVPPDFRTVRAQELIGKDIRGAQGENIGDVEDVVMNRNGRAIAVLTDVGGFLGIGGRRVAIPINELSRQGDQLTTTMTKERVQQLQAYDENQWEPFDRNRQLSEAQR